MEETKRCPFCAEEVLAAAIKCKHCGSLLDEALAAVKSSGRKKSSLVGRILTVLGLALFASLGVVVLSAIYAGHLEGARAIDWVQNRLGPDFNVEIFSYRKGVGETYVCGMAFPRRGPVSGGKLYYVVEKGIFPHVTMAGIDGDKNFGPSYEFTCGDVNPGRGENQ